jgi:hypothetical protein
MLPCGKWSRDLWDWPMLRNPNPDHSTSSPPNLTNINTDGFMVLQKRYHYST